ncbi:uncharacterized protein LOC111706027 [Eurytemora carolleeae]|uniref:uncharacterized protein LOC111706027 n=1 Tax=Eurytemora carolleeae TaxID=1294199 RepID=UPI000C79310E|nr:uncharacterized protein LOC111706027 [Eurytemora carolleeae]|eukprot:XP_023334546.1 uncharacterized protein LOC111706027 [Eurytemora affinis]
MGEHGRQDTMTSYSYSYRGTGDEKCPPVYSYQYNTCQEEDDSIEFKLRCPSITSFRWCLKLYSLVLGGLGTFLSFIWVCFHLYVLSQTEIHDLRMMRYLDIGLGLMMFSSMISLIYAGYAESKSWLVVYTTGSMSVLVLYWSWTGYNKYVSKENPEYNEEVEEVTVVLTIVYCVLLIPLILYYRAIHNTGHIHCNNCQNCQHPTRSSYRTKQLEDD